MVRTYGDHRVPCDQAPSRHPMKHVPCLLQASTLPIHINERIAKRNHPPKPILVHEMVNHSPCLYISQSSTS